MSLRDDLIAKATDLVADRSEGWADKLIDQGRELVDELIERDAAEDEDIIEAASGALDLLDENKQPFLRLTNIGFAYLVAHWEDDDKAEARRHYLATRATYSERRAAMQRGGDASARTTDARNAAWDEVEKTLKQVGTLGLKFLANLAAKSVGLPFSI